MTYSDTNRFLHDALEGFYPDREIDSIGRLVMEHLTGMTWVQVRLSGEKVFTDNQEEQIREIVSRLKSHEPIQYILGETEFYGLRFGVRRGVLIPRGETEELVEWIMKSIPVETHHDASFIGPSSTAGPKGKGLRFLDIGCGSGAIAVSLAKHLPGAEVVASDISDEAIAITRENAALNKVKLTLACLDILAFSPEKPGTPLAIDEPFDVIVSNPPYIPVGEMKSMDPHVIEHEPEIALFVPDDDPLIFYRAIARFAHANLNAGGQVFVEIHDRLGVETVAVFSEWFKNVDLRKDIHGKDRMICASHG